jgi:hypothetical protein
MITILNIPNMTDLTRLEEVLTEFLVEALLWNTLIDAILINKRNLSETIRGIGALFELLSISFVKSRSWLFSKRLLSKG